ncbi:ATP-binding protein [Desulfovibrio sp. X2]|uniref:ATP-binding protein n=1 Tax=Desulfovibrio sp. X2 TaxID=941449 RepID=UPI00068CA838|nr:ATP-binding protein [Desulfovibrio sp. X2]
MAERSDTPDESASAGGLRAKGLREIMEKGPAVAFLWEDRPDLPVRLVSGNVSRFGYCRADFGPDGLRFMDIVAPPDKTRLEQALGHARGGQEQTLRLCLLAGNGEVRHAHLQIWPPFDGSTVQDPESGESVGLLQGVILDVTAEARAEAALAEGEARYRSLFEHSPISLWEEDLSAVKEFFDELRGRGVRDFAAHFTAHPEDLRHCARLCVVLDTNQASLAIFEAESREELRGRLHRLLDEPSMAGFAARMTALASGATVFSGEARHRSRRGRVFETQVQVCVPQGYEQSLARVIVSIMDISERRAAERASTRSSEFVRQVLETISLPVFVKDAESRFVLVNEAFCTLFAMPRERIIGSSDFDIVPAELADRFRKKDMQVLSTRLPLGYDAEVEDGEGRTRHLFIRKGAADLPLSGESVVVGIIQDLTERMRMERELTQARDEAQAADRAKTEFLANMSHELRTPMNAIIGMSDLVLNGELGAEQRDFVSTIGESARTLLRIVNDILDYSRIEARGLELESVDFSLRGLVQGVIKGLVVEAERKGLALGATVADDVPDSLRGDPGRLRQVLVNLVGNAIKFTERGEVRVRAKRAGLVAPGVLLRFEVRDTGIGIPGERSEAIFERFTQADGSITRRYGGTGLGLAICRRLVGLMGGEISVASDPGQGSTFTFTARFAPGGPLVERPAYPGDVERIEPLNVLVVEDNPVNQKLAGAFLGRSGHRYMIVGDGAAALDLLGRHCFDVVLMDARMPVMDGLTATRVIRGGGREHVNPGVAIIGMTGRVSQMDREEMLAAGMDDVVPKPVDFLLLQTAMMRVMHRRMRCAAQLPGTDASKEAAPGNAFPSGAASEGRAFSMNAAGAAERPPSGYERAEALERLGGDEGFLLELIEVFKEDAPQKLAELEQAAEAMDRPMLREAAHSLKGGAAAVGAANVRDAAKLVEDTSAEAAPEELRAGIARLRAEFERIVDLLD